MQNMVNLRRTRKFKLTNFQITLIALERVLSLDTRDLVMEMARKRAMPFD